jgi:TolA-binding protein
MKKYRLLIILVSLVVFSCGVNNTMFNARKYFNLAQSRPLNANGRPTPQAVEEYTKAIKKCGIILSEPKQSRNTDDALYLMARALYLKGNSAFQAKDQFDALIKNFPESPFYGEAHIYLARVYRDINKKAEALKVLEDFIRDPAQKELHPKALLTMAEFEITDKNYGQAQYWLEKIITNYPKSEEYEGAFFLFGKNYYVQKDYAASLREFQKLAGNRKIPGTLKQEALYYVALNQFLLGDLQQSWKNTEKLLKDEDRPDKLAQVRVLKVRLLFARGENNKAIAEAEDISKVYPRTLGSAEAQYWLGEYYFYRNGDLDKAMTAYNKVRAEYPTSEYAEVSQRKAVAINQLKQKTNLNGDTNLQQFVDYYINSAENYLNQFALPDSALLMYQEIIDTGDRYSGKMDSLQVRLSAKQAQIDSLTARMELLTPASEVDSVFVGSAEADTLEIDSLFTQEVMDESTPEPDSLIAAELKQLKQNLLQANSELESWQANVKTILAVILRFQRELTPLALFSQASILNKSGVSSERIRALYDRMLIEFPENKYTSALGSMIAGEPIRLIDPAENNQEQEIDLAYGLSSSAPDSLVSILQKLTESDYSNIALRANFRLGWFYTFDITDTTLAKSYLDAALKIQQTGDYATLISRFYNGKTFRHTLFYTEPDTLAEINSADSLMLIQNEITASDSIFADKDTIAVSDSLSNPSSTEEPPQDIPGPSINLPGEDNTNPENVPDRKEEYPLPEEPSTPKQEGNGSLPQP